MTAGIYAARGGLKTVIVEKEAVGGQIIRTAEVENYPATGTVTGVDLAMNIYAQTEACGVEFEFDNAVAVDLAGETKRASLESGDVLIAPFIIIATGAESRKLDVSGEQKLLGRGVSYCATCDGALYRNKAVMVVGGGNTAVEDALYLCGLASSVYVVHRRQGFRADKVLMDKLNASKAIQLLDSVLDEIKGNGKVESVMVRNVVSGETREVAVDGIFVAVGQIPQNALCDNLNKDGNGYIVTDSNMATGIKGVYAVGDLREKPLRQVVTACNDGAVAASAVISEFLKK